MKLFNALNILHNKGIDNYEYYPKHSISFEMKLSVSDSMHSYLYLYCQIKTRKTEQG